MRGPEGGGLSARVCGIGVVGALALALLVVPGEAQVLAFGHTWGSFGYDTAYAIDVDSAGNVYIAGEMFFRSGPSLGFLAKFDSDGRLLWDRTFMSAAGFYLWDLDIAPGGDVYLLGDSYADNEVVVLRVSPDGDVRFARVLEGLTYVYRIQADPATGGAFVETSTVDADAIVALDTTGQPRWAVRVAGGGYAYPYGLATDSAGNSYGLLTRIDGQTGEYDLGLVKFDPSGDVVAQMILDLTVDAGAYDIVRGADGSLLALGWSPTGPLLAKLDDQLGAAWTEVLAASVPVLDLWTLTALPDGSFAASGGVWDYPTVGDFQVPVIAFDSSGSLISAVGFVSPQYVGDRYVYDAATSAQGEVLLAGETLGVPDHTPYPLPLPGTESIGPTAWREDNVVWEPFAVTTRPFSYILSDPSLPEDDFRASQDFQAWWGAFDPLPGDLTVDARVTSVNSLEVAFEATVSGGNGAYSFDWSFGDGQRSTLAVPSHTYAETGRFPVQLVVRDSAGAMGWDGILLELTLPPEIALFEAFPNPASTGRLVDFYADVVDPDGGDTFRFDWTFGDGETASTATPTVQHAYQAVGTFTATLDVTDDEGESSSASAVVEIVSNPLPTACFEWSPAVPRANERVGFDASCSMDDSAIDSYAWDFGDGGTASGPFAAHVFTAEGTYPVTLTVVDDSSAAAFVSHDVSVVGVLEGVGELEIRPTVNSATTVFVNGIARNDWNLLWRDVAPGNYEVSFSDVPGRITPGPFQVVVVADTSTFLTPFFQPVGWLRVITDPALPATISVNGMPRDDWGLWLPVESGPYTVEFGAVAGYLTPPPQTVFVSATTTVVVGSYVASPGAPGPDPATFGRLRVTTGTDDGTTGVPTTISVDGITSNIWALDFLKLPPGAHVVEFSDVPGLGTPNPIAVNIVAGTTTSVQAIFARLGQLRITAFPYLGAPIFVDGNRMNDAGTWIQMRPGTYTVSWGLVLGYATPEPQTVTVVAGARTDVSGQYTPITSSAAFVTDRQGAAAPSDGTPDASGASQVPGPVSTDATPAGFSRELVAARVTASGTGRSPE
jgi:PKD repeat protein